MTATNSPSTISADEALNRLREGNARFVQNVRSTDVALGSASRASLAAGQRPFAIILSCSDSRVPSEIVFDQGLGDLFVIRVAGNIVAPSLVGSVEFAAATFGTRLAVVMGHSRCGAIKATLDALRQGTSAPSENIQAIVDRCRPAVDTVLRAGSGGDEEAVLSQAIRANVRNSCDHLRHGSRILEDLVRSDGMRIVGAEYALETGAVEFFDGV